MTELIQQEHRAESSPLVFCQLTEICSVLARGDVAQARKLLATIRNAEAPPFVDGLVEALSKIAVRLEAREYHLEKLVAEPDAAAAEQARLKQPLARDTKQLKDPSSQAVLADRMVSVSPAMQEVLRQAERMAQVHATVLLTGETGTGKGLLARTMHDSGPRAAGPFVAVNCAAIPATLLESELFGIEKGVASGVAARIGRFEQADGGTIFLDEVGDMPIENQAKILHGIESNTVERVGGRRSVPVDVRIIAATHRDLAAMCRERLFRSDLYYRLNVLRLHIPPLRERKEDIRPLAEHFLKLFSLRNPGAATCISANAMEIMEAHDWPGNIRELENEIERAALLARHSAIVPLDLSPTLDPRAISREQDVSEASPDFDRSDGERSGLPLEKLRPLRTLEADTIRQALAETGGNKSQAARILGISREGLRKMLKRLRLEA